MTYNRAHRIVRRLNALFGNELGRGPTGLPVRAWLWSEDEVRSKRVCDAHGNPCYEYPSVPEPMAFRGIRKPGTIVKAIPLYKKEKLVPHLKDSWFLASLVSICSFDEWKATFGDSAEWPAGGMYFPCEDWRGIIAVQPGLEPPSEEDTWYTIRKIKEDRAEAIRKLEEKWAPGRDPEDLRQKAAKDKIQGILDPLLPRYSPDPGSCKGAALVMNNAIRQNPSFDPSTIPSPSPPEKSLILVP